MSHVTESLPIERAVAMIMSQYSTSPNLNKYIEIMMVQFDEVNTSAQACNDDRFIGTGVGHTLDVLAEIVGTKRVLGGVASEGYFGYYENPNALGQGDANYPNQGGILKSEGLPDTGDLSLQDSQLRNSIRAKIIKNSERCNINDIIKYIELVLSNPLLDIECVKGTGARLNITIHAILTNAERSFIANTIKEIKASGVLFTLADDSGNIVLPPTVFVPRNELDPSLDEFDKEEDNGL